MKNSMLIGLGKSIKNNCYKKRMILKKINFEKLQHEIQEFRVLFLFNFKTKKKIFLSVTR